MLRRNMLCSEPERTEQRLRSDRAVPVDFPKKFACRSRAGATSPAHVGPLVLRDPAYTFRTRCCGVFRDTRSVSTVSALTWKESCQPDERQRHEACTKARSSPSALKVACQIHKSRAILNCFRLGAGDGSCSLPASCFIRLVHGNRDRFFCYAHILRDRRFSGRHAPADEPARAV